MRRAFLVATVAAAVAAAALAACDSGSSATGPISLTVTHYDYKLDLGTLAAHAEVTATVTTAGNCVTIPMRAQAVANVTLSGRAADSATQDATSLTACGQGFDVGDTLVLATDDTVAMGTVSTSQIGFSTTNDADGNPFTYLVSWVGGCDRFAPCDNRPDQFATYHFDVTHDASLTVRCPGDITEDSATETECTFDHPGGPTYSTFGIAAYPAWTQTDKGTFGGIHVTVYDRADTGIAAAIDPVWHDGFITWMQSEFGPYPFGTELRVLTGPTYWNGFEHPGNIVLNDTLPEQKNEYANNVAHVLDHEMTHMWAGDQTTLAGTYDFAWKEAMAEYLAFVWEDMNDAAISSQTAYVWKADSASVTHYPVPLDHPDLFDYYTDVYGPGPLVLFRQLEVLSSRAQVLAALQSVLGSPHALSVDDLLAALAQSTGLDLTDYANGWIKGSGAPTWPQFAMTYADGMLHVRQTNAGATPMGCAFHLAMYGADPTDVVSVAVDTFHNGTDQMIPVTPAPAFAVASYVIDPDHECLVFASGQAARGDRSHRPWVAPR